MKKFPFGRPVAIPAILLALSCAAPHSSAGRESPAPGDKPSAGARPNILFILSDDQGIGDVGCYGSPDVRTPAIDALASRGVRLARFYANGPECSPTRAALMTGRYQHRVGGLECAIGLGNVGRYDDAIRLAARGELGLPPEERSIARLVKDAGYETAIFGKWHLGYERKFLPDRHGFDRSFGPLGGAVDYYRHCEPDGTRMLYENGAPVERQGYMTDLITEEAVRFLRAPHPKPFFLYVPYTAPHSPFQAPGERPDRPLAAAEWEKGSRSIYVQMVERMDHGIGEILEALDATGLAHETLVIFASDNGADPRGSNGTLRGRKGGLFEGGVRVPCVVRWPGVLREGTVSTRPTMMMDLTASIARAAGATPDRPFDGIDVLGDEARGARPRPRALFWRARRGTVTWRSVLEGPLKYVSRQDGRSIEEYLFDLDRDPNEELSLIGDRKEEADRLKAHLAAWEIQVRPSR